MANWNSSTSISGGRNVLKFLSSFYNTYFFMNILKTVLVYVLPSMNRRVLRKEHWIKFAVEREDYKGDRQMNGFKV